MGRIFNPMSVSALAFLVISFAAHGWAAEPSPPAAEASDHATSAAPVTMQPSLAPPATDGLRGGDGHCSRIENNTPTREAFEAYL